MTSRNRIWGMTIFVVIVLAAMFMGLCARDAVGVGAADAVPLRNAVDRFATRPVTAHRGGVAPVDLVSVEAVRRGVVAVLRSRDPFEVRGPVVVLATVAMVDAVAGAGRWAEEGRGDERVHGDESLPQSAAQPDLQVAGLRVDVSGDRSRLRDAATRHRARVTHVASTAHLVRPARNRAPLDRVHAANLFPAGYARYGKLCAAIQQSVWGPYWSSMLLAQIEQESAWNPFARSPYANGLTQFTPATQREMERRLGVSGSIMDPGHACLLQAHLMRSLARDTGPRFDGWLSQWHATLRCYNGSPRSFWREWALAGRPSNTVAMESYCVRSAAHCRENMEYPWRITRLWRKYLHIGWPA